MPEDSPPGDVPNAAAGPDGTRGGSNAKSAGASRLTGTVVSHLADQARRTASAARAGRVMDGDDEPGVLDLTPLRELLAELVEEVQKLRLRDRIANALRQAADIIGSSASKR